MFAIPNQSLPYPLPPQPQSKLTLPPPPPRPNQSLPYPLPLPALSHDTVPFNSCLHLLFKDEEEPGVLAALVAEELPHPPGLGGHPRHLLPLHFVLYPLLLPPSVPGFDVLCLVLLGLFVDVNLITILGSDVPLVLCNIV